MCLWWWLICYGWFEDCVKIIVKFFGVMYNLFFVDNWDFFIKERFYGILLFVVFWLIFEFNSGFVRNE